MLSREVCSAYLRGVHCSRCRYSFTGPSIRWQRLATALTATWHFMIVRRVRMIASASTARRRRTVVAATVAQHRTSPTFVCMPPASTFCRISASSTRLSGLVRTWTCSRLRHVRTSLLLTYYTACRDVQVNCTTLWQPNLHVAWLAMDVAVTGGTSHEPPGPMGRLAPTVKHTGAESRGKLCEIFKFWSFLQ